MKHEIKKLPNSAVEVTMHLMKGEIEPVKEAILAKMVTEVEIPGFRKGKAPFPIVEQNYKEAVTGQIVEEMLDKHYNDIFKGENIIPVSHIMNIKTDLKDSDMDIIFSVDVYPEVELGEYKGLEVEKETFEMNDEVINKEIEMILNNKATFENAPEGHKAQLGDSVDVAFEGFVDGVAFEGGKSDSHSLKLGSKMFIDTFEDQLVGYMSGQEGEVNVKFPENYHQETLAGKPAVFKVKVNSIKLLNVPELTDEIAKEFGYESVTDLKEKKKEEITTRETSRIENDYRGRLIEKIAENTKVDIPFSMIAGEIKNRVTEMENQLQRQGIGMDMYMKMTGMTVQDLEKQIAPSAAFRVKSDLILNAIAKKESIEASEEEIKKQMDDIAKMYNITFEKLEEEINKNGNMEAFKSSVHAEIILNKALQVVTDSAK
ncbi:trigger factor [Fusobacterium sp. PH5-44]|uniref:trigger factor n=1 Tax=unclassified Fusobacterium TaxID=2648384 RepID=UPI003D19EECB